MKERNQNWKKDFTDGTIFKVPTGYFESLPDKILDRIHQEGYLVNRPDKIRLLRPWMAWVGSAAAVLVVGWLGIRTLVLQPDLENIRQKQITNFIDYYGADFDESHLAGFIEEAGFEIATSETTEYNELILEEPDNAEAYIYESIIY